MCGIAVIVGDEPERFVGTLERMVETLRHRGPDGAQCRILPGCGLGHRRLSVIDVTGGAQPMSDASGRYWIVLNGEVYNYRDLRRELEARGARFRTQSDTEVLLQAYLHHGEEVPRHLNGQFAFAIWDVVDRRLFAARDRLGEKPLYWAPAEQGTWLFASEIKALEVSGLIEPRLDPMAVELYLALLHVPPDRTIYVNVHTLRPGWALTWQRGSVRQWPYWQPAYSTTPGIDVQEAVAGTRGLLERAVRRQLTAADVPVGAFLSGGLDSSTVVALMRAEIARPVTVSVGFGDLIDELPYARAVARAYQTEHHEIQMDIPVGETLERLASVYDEPLADSSTVPTYWMAAAARRHVKVALSGDGGDELFGGYEWYAWLDPAWASRSPARMGFQAVARRALSLVHLASRTGAAEASRSLRVARAARRHPDPWTRRLILATTLRGERATWWGGRSPGNAEAVLRASFFPAGSIEGLDRATDFDARVYLPGDILVKVDRAAMAHGLETRTPFLDAELVEFVWRLPWQLRLPGGGLKWLLRAACSDLWPSVLLGRPKQGFGAPIWSWVERPDVRSLLHRVTSVGSPLAALLPGVPGRLVGLKPQARWTLLCLGLWLERRPHVLRRMGA